MQTIRLTFPVSDDIIIINIRLTEMHFLFQDGVNATLACNECNKG